MHINKGSNKNIASSFYKSVKSFAEILPMLLGIILLVGLFQTFVSKQIIASVFTGNVWQDTLIGAVTGSISAGNPIASYMIGGELLKQQVSLLAITSFMVAWVTVGIIQFPAEAFFLGRRFAIARNIISFILSILVSMATVTTLALIQ